jgi:hypothetical protein
MMNWISIKDKLPPQYALENNYCSHEYALVQAETEDGMYTLHSLAKYNEQMKKWEFLHYIDKDYPVSSGSCGQKNPVEFGSKDVTHWMFIEYPKESNE